MGQDFAPGAAGGGVVRLVDDDEIRLDCSVKAANERLH